MHILCKVKSINPSIAKTGLLIEELSWIKVNKFGNNLCLFLATSSIKTTALFSKSKDKLQSYFPTGDLSVELLISLNLIHRAKKSKI